MATSSLSVEDSRASYEIIHNSPLYDTDFSRWMENLPNEKQLCPLKNLVIPGSHDSAAFQLDYEGEVGPDEPPYVHNLVRVFGRLAKSVILNWSLTQSLNIYQQLKAGIRYLDLRVAYKKTSEEDENGELRIIHGLYGCTVRSVLLDVKRFIDHYTKEIVILDFNHFYAMDEASHHLLASMIVDLFGGAIAPPVDEGVNLTLHELWGYERQVIVIYHDDVYAKLYPELWQRNAISAPWYDTPCEKQLIHSLHSAVCESTIAARNCFHVTQAILTPQGSTVAVSPTGSLKDNLAIKCNCTVVEWLKDISSNMSQNFNIVMADFVESSDFIPTIVSMNYFY